MIKKVIACIALIGLLSTTLPAAIASAHVLKTDGSIGVVLHINPDDNPISGRQTNYVLYFNDIDGRFTLPDCTCGLTISQNGAVIAKKSLAVTSSLVSSNTFTFPQPAVYLLHVTGSPKVNGTFQPFSLDYSVRVSGNEATPQGQFPLLLWVAIGLDMLLVLLFAVVNMYTDEITQKNE